MPSASRSLPLRGRSTAGTSVFYRRKYWSAWTKKRGEKQKPRKKGNCTVGWFGGDWGKGFEEDRLGGRRQKAERHIVVITLRCQIWHICELPNLVSFSTCDRKNTRFRFRFRFPGIASTTRRGAIHHERSLSLRRGFSRSIIFIYIFIYLFTCPY